MNGSEIFAKILIDGELTEGPIVAGDYTLGVRDIEGGHQLVITKGGQTQTLDVLDGLPGAQGPEGPAGQDGQPGQPGQDGSDGQDGISPTVDVDEITGGHRVTITDAEGAHVFDVMDGETGAQGPQGETGATGQQGETGPQGPQGPQGETGPQGPQGPAGQDAVVDATLTQAGQAADAKATGDALDEIKDALTASVSTNEQNLTEAQQMQARKNLGLYYKEGEETVIEWDGDTTGRATVDGGKGLLYKVSDRVFAPLDFVGGTALTSMGTSLDVEPDLVMEPAPGFTDLAAVAFSARAGVYDIGHSITIPEDGVYFLYKDGLFITRFEKTTETVHKIEEKYLPDFATESYVNQQISAAIADVDTLLGSGVIE